MLRASILFMQVVLLVTYQTIIQLRLAKVNGYAVQNNACNNDGSVHTPVWGHSDLWVEDMKPPFSSSMLRIMTSLCISFVRMSSKPLFENYCYVNEDRLYNTERIPRAPSSFFVQLEGKKWRTAPPKNCWPTVGRLSFTAFTKIFCQQSADCWPHIGNLLAKCRLRTLVEKSLSSQERTLHINAKWNFLTWVRHIVLVFLGTNLLAISPGERFEIRLQHIAELYPVH